MGRGRMQRCICAPTVRHGSLSTSLERSAHSRARARRQRLVCCTDGGGAEARSAAAHPGIPLAQRHSDDFPLQYRPIPRACSLSLPSHPPPSFSMPPSFPCAQVLLWPKQQITVSSPVKLPLNFAWHCVFLCASVAKQHVAAALTCRPTQRCALPVNLVNFAPCHSDSQATSGRHP